MSTNDNYPPPRPSPLGSDGALWSRAPIAPAPGVYVTRDDRLIVRSLGSVVAVLEVRARLQLPNGEVIPLTFTHTPATDRTFVTTVQELTEGFLLGVTAEPASGTVVRGESFVFVGLLRGTAAGNDTAVALFADYVRGSLPCGWPAGPVLSSVEGPGVLRVVTGAVPAAGADPTLPVPSGARWRVMSVRAALTTAVAVATRTPVLRVLVGPTPTLAYDVRGDSDQVASLTYTYVGGVGAGNQALYGGRFALPLPVCGVLPAGSVIDFLTGSLQAADQWTAITAWVEEWQELGTAS